MKKSPEKIHAAVKSYYVGLSKRHADTFGKAATRYPADSDTAQNLRLVAAGHAARQAAWEEGREVPKVSKEEQEADKALRRATKKDTRLKVTFGFLGLRNVAAGIAAVIGNTAIVGEIAHPGRTSRVTAKAPAAE